ncbi:DEAD-domain-containing protein [Annulohypoxylon maeteangense]|uniref:DEAD-domain-containing protein n=1 Tax=Annulohypoxylon maeteangense TaxID=1927788 RepID=UPI002008D7B4|nr:DEAD-domain-containing protein [Annulohypoxylon maeteangense]KAI0887035.1 DEAD-domain-containing protein [Annulohypoxylon maeteangense]
MQEPHSTPATSSKPRRRPGRGKRHQQEYGNEFQQQSEPIDNDSRPFSLRGRPQNKGKNKDLQNGARAFSTLNTLRNAASATAAEAEVPTSDGDAVETLPSIPTPEDTPLFTDLAKGNLIDPVLLQTIAEDLNFKHMTPVQAATIYPLLKENCDMLAQAKTGTGKTIAFLLPAIQKIIHRPDHLRGSVSLLVISPTRELAMQIAKEARALMQRLKKFKVCIAIGGTNKNEEEKRIAGGCDILVATPGRLNDHLTTPDSSVKRRLQSVDTLVLDEADRLLDMGFIDPIKKIIQCLPPRSFKQRQGMLFSATVPQRVKQVASLALSQDYKTISTINEGELNTHERVPQKLIVANTFSDVGAILLSALRRERKHVGPDTFKAIVFAPTARQADFYAQVLEKCPGLPSITTLHSRMTQSKRTNITAAFREAKSQILVATDVIARGMDFPSVTNVFQVGVPSDKESYVHRLGRTARAGAEGRGTFIITSHELYFPKRILSNIKFEEEETADVSAAEEFLKIAKSLGPETHGKTYQAWLGFYKSLCKPLGWDDNRLVREANKLALNGMGAPEIPSLQKSTVGKMGLKGVSGLNVRPNDPKEKRGGDGDNSGTQDLKRPRTGA